MKNAAVHFVMAWMFCSVFYAQKMKPAAASDPETAVKARYDAWKNKDARTWASLVTDDLVVVGSGGTSDKAAVLGDMKACTLNSYSITDFKQIKADPNVLILTFRSKEDGACSGVKAPENVVVSEVLVKRGGKWLCIYHHETVADKT